MGVFTIIDNYGIKKEIPFIRALDGKDALTQAVEAGFSEGKEKFCENLAGMDNPYYSVGAVFYSTINTSPSSLFGGSWEQINDVFILCSGDNYAVNSTGGEVEVTLEVENLPAHKHTVNGARFTSGSNRAEYYVNSQNITTRGIAKGGSLPHNNMPPYLVVYAWKKIS